MSVGKKSSSTQQPLFEFLRSFDSEKEPIVNMRPGSTENASWIQEEYSFVSFDDDFEDTLSYKTLDTIESLAENVAQMSIADKTHHHPDNQKMSLSSQSNFELYNFAILPEHACQYCGIHNPGSVVKCLGCLKWFCNGRGGGIAGIPPTTSGSHILHHLIRSKHKECMLHPESAIGDAILECYACGCRNLFLLGYIQAKADNVVVLLCRYPCAQASSKDENWDSSSWAPLIKDRALLPWLISEPTTEELLRSRRVSQAILNQLEDAWKAGKVNTTYADVLKASVDHLMPELLPTKAHYSDTKEYKEIFVPLVKLEAEYDKSLKEAQVLENVTIRWDRGLNGKHVAWFLLTSTFSGDADFRVAPGDEVEISFTAIPSKRWKATGAVIKVPMSFSEEISVELRGPAGVDLDADEDYTENVGVGSSSSNPLSASFKVPTDITEGFKIQFVWKSTAYDRMLSALSTLSRHDDCIGPGVIQKLMGFGSSSTTEESQSASANALPKKLSAPNLPELNHSQAHAVRSAFGRSFSLIQGPPGTGKTVTTATLVYHLVKQGKGPVLVCAPSNVAVDHLTEKIHQTGLRCVRIAAKWRESVDTSVAFLCMHEQIKALELEVATSTSNPNGGTTSSAAHEFRKLSKLKVDQGGLSGKDEHRFHSLRTKLEQAVLSAADVVLCTCVGAGDTRIGRRARFQTVLIDEATQATEPEALIPIVKGAEQVVLIGDHRQLGPVIMSKQAAKAGLKISLFERLISVGVRPIRLQVQYRMHPCLSEFPSNMFYDGSLQNGISEVERARPEMAFTWPDPKNPMFFLNVYGTEELSVSGTSYLNRAEAAMVEQVATKLMRAGVNPIDIGVITPYEGQRAYILQFMQSHGPLHKDLYGAIEVASVDAFQGREKDFIILSCVRSNDHQGIGFLSDPRRLNVALTRAKFGLILVGNARVLSRNNLWNALLAHFKHRAVLMDGTLANMRPSLMHFNMGNQKTRTTSVPSKQIHQPQSSNVPNISDPYFDDSAYAPNSFMNSTDESAFYYYTDDETQSQLTQSYPSLL